MEPSSWIALGALFCLTGASAFFTGTQTAVLSADANRIASLVEDGSRSAQRLQKFLDDPGMSIAVGRIGSIISLVIAAAIAGGPVTTQISSGLGNSTLASFLVIITAGTLLILFGTTVPRAIAARHWESWSLMMVVPYAIAGWILRPVIYLFALSSDWVLKPFDAHSHAKAGTDVTAGIRELIEEGEKQGPIDPEGVAMIHGVLDISHEPVRSIMVPRPDMVMVPAGTTAREALDVAIEKGFSRLPIYVDSVDTVLGVVSVREIAGILREEGNGSTLVENVAWKPHFVPETKLIDDLLSELRSLQIHLAIVVDEYGDTAGIVTMEDIIEEIVGEIRDETDVEDPAMVPINKDVVVVDGRTRVSELNQHLNINLEVADADTVGGAVFVTLGHVPAVGESLEIDNIHIEVLRIENTRIRRLKISRNLSETVRHESDD